MAPYKWVDGMVQRGIFANLSPFRHLAPAQANKSYSNEQKTI